LTLLPASGDYVMSPAHVCDIFDVKTFANSNLTQSQCHNAVSDSVQFDLDQITDVPEPVPVNMWLDHTITNENKHKQQRQFTHRCHICQCFGSKMFDLTLRIAVRLMFLHYLCRFHFLRYKTTLCHCLRWQFYLHNIPLSTN